VAARNFSFMVKPFGAFRFLRLQFLSMLFAAPQVKFPFRKGKRRIDLFDSLAGGLANAIFP
jgi:hypothetical protein